MHYLIEIIDYIVRNLPEMLAGIGTIALAIFAYIGLDTWRSEHKKKIQSDLFYKFLLAMALFNSGLSSCLNLIETMVKPIVGKDSKDPYDDSFMSEYMSNFGNARAKEITKNLDQLQRLLSELSSLIDIGAYMNLWAQDDTLLHAKDSVQIILNDMKILAADFGSDWEFVWDQVSFDVRLLSHLKFDKDKVESCIRDKFKIMVDFLSAEYQKTS